MVRLRRFSSAKSGANPPILVAEVSRKRVFGRAPSGAVARPWSSAAVTDPAGCGHRGASSLSMGQIIAHELPTKAGERARHNLGQRTNPLISKGLWGTSGGTRTPDRRFWRGTAAV